MKPPRSKCHLFCRDHQVDCAFKGRERARLPEFRDIPNGNADCASYANSILMPRTRVEFTWTLPNEVQQCGHAAGAAFKGERPGKRAIGDLLKVLKTTSEMAPVLPLRRRCGPV